MSKQWWHSLPFDYHGLKVSVGSRPVGFRFSQSIINIEAEFRDVSFLTCGEANTQDLAMTKAIAELLERTAMKDWLDKNPHSGIKSSNGWAAHQSPEAARLNAIYERVERDAVLAQWYSATPFIQISPASVPHELRAWVMEELSQSELPILKILISTMGLCPSVTCLFMNESGFGVSGHAAKPGLQESIESALAEACRSAHHHLRRSFWNDSVHLKQGDFTQRIQPGAHAVYYAYHEPFPTWMFGPELSWSGASAYWIGKVRDFSRTELPRFSFHVALEDPMFVGFASHPDTFEIVWGSTDPKVVLETAANRRFASPITERTLNRRPHIIS
ncbi:MAG: YcaO-like family protein [Bdellovibrionaceae bacterium]|nr:YcaO-like family protein [Pseudobdellovibrionaceae bacterium]